MTRSRYADVTATLALVAALGTGAYAAGLPKNSVTSATVKDGSLKSRDLAKAARPAATFAASVGPLADKKLTAAFVRIGGLTYSQPPGTLDDIRGHFGLRGGVGGETCSGAQSIEYQLVVDGLEHNPEIGSGAGGSANAARDGDGTEVPGVNGTDAITDIQTIGSEYPVINSTRSAVTRAVDVYMAGNGCTPTIRGLQLYVTRFKR